MVLDLVFGVPAPAPNCDVRRIPDGEIAVRAGSEISNAMRVGDHPHVIGYMGYISQARMGLRRVSEINLIQITCLTLDLNFQDKQIMYYK